MPAFILILTPALSLTRPNPISQRCTHRQFVIPPRNRISPSSFPPRLTPRASFEDTLDLSEENVNQALEEVREKLGSVFGNSEENRQIGITGDVELFELDGPYVVLRFKGRFWHKRSDVLARVSSFLRQRIPEISDVTVPDPGQLDDTLESEDR